MNKIKTKTKFILVLVLISIIFLGLNGISANNTCQRYYNDSNIVANVSNASVEYHDIIMDKTNYCECYNNDENNDSEFGQHEIIYTNSIHPEEFDLEDIPVHNPEPVNDLPPFLKENMSNLKYLNNNINYENISDDSTLITSSKYITTNNLTTTTDEDITSDSNLISNTNYNYIDINPEYPENNSVPPKNIPKPIGIDPYISYYNSNLTNNKVRVKIKTRDIIYNYGDRKIFDVKLLDETDNPLKNQIILFTINSRTYVKQTDNDGQARIKIDLKPGSYNINTTFVGNDFYSSESVQNRIKITNKTETRLSANNIYMVYNEDRTHQIKLTDKNNNSLINQTVKLLVNKYNTDKNNLTNQYKSTVQYNVKTNEKGYVSLKIKLKPGIYNITGEYLGDTHYYPSACSNFLTIISYNKGNTKYEGEPISPYLIETGTCQKNNTIIKELAQSLTKGKKTTVEKANAIYSYVKENIKYENYLSSNGALETLKQKTGNCTDQAHLIVALCRSIDIPARYCYGTEHVWTQILDKDNAIWITADTTTKSYGFGIWNTYPLYTTYSSI